MSFQRAGDLLGAKCSAVQTVQAEAAADIIKKNIIEICFQHISVEITPCSSYEKF
jgi:hypothetical protein